MARPLTKGKAEPVEGAPPDPLANPRTSQKLAATKEFVQQLVRAIRASALYRHATAKFLEFLEKPYKTLVSVTEQFGAIQWKVETQSFTLFKQDLLGHETGENLPYKFYKDGIRHLIFRPASPRRSCSSSP